MFTVTVYTGTCLDVAIAEANEVVACLRSGTESDTQYMQSLRDTHLTLSVLKVLLLQGFAVMQSQACCSSIELGANTTGTSKLAPSQICIPAAKMEDRHTVINIDFKV